MTARIHCLLVTVIKNLSDANLNPLCQPHQLPPFSRIKAEHVVPAVEAALEEANRTLENVLNHCAKPTWENLIVPLENLGELLERSWSPVRHLHAVMDTPELRLAYADCQQKLNLFHTTLSQNEELYSAVTAIIESDGWSQLDSSQQRLVENTRREFRLGGVGLSSEPKQRFKDISAQLAQSCTQFANHVLDATQAWTKHLTNEDDLAGLPQSAVDLARQNAQRKDKSGWLLTLDLPCYIPVMNYADNPILREEMHYAYVTRASEYGPQAGRFDNGPLMHEILALRQERAALLGFAHHGEYSLARKMANSPEQVLTFLRDLAAQTRPFALKELSTLVAFSAEHGCTELQPYDIPYYAEKYKQRHYAFNQEDVRPYLPAVRVVQGLFDLAQQLFEIRIQVQPDVDVWNSEVKYFQIFDAHDELVGGFYLDLYARPDKRGGAWMDVCRNRVDLGQGLQRPVAYLTCNFTPPGEGHDALLSHDEVTTLFHEFGHGLHHLLSRVDLPGITGINGVEWDAVELPSQFMENWCYEPQVLTNISAHYQSGATLPLDLINKLQAARKFHSGLHMLRQIEFALFDFRLHMEYHPGFDIHTLAQDVHDEIAVVPRIQHNRYTNSFSHLFDGGYAAGYYSYKWAEVLSSDAFSRFEEEGLDSISQPGRAFKHEILERGGSRDAMDSFIAFRGRAPDSNALLRHSGLEPDSSAA